MRLLADESSDFAVVSALRLAGHPDGDAIRGHYAASFTWGSAVSAQKMRRCEGNWNAVVGTVKTKRVILVHWDNFFQPADEPLHLFPLSVAFDNAFRKIRQQARANGVQLLLPVP